MCRVRTDPEAKRRCEGSCAVKSGIVRGRATVPLVFGARYVVNNLQPSVTLQMWFRISLSFELCPLYRVCKMGVSSLRSLLNWSSELPVFRTQTENSVHSLTSANYNVVSNLMPMCMIPMYSSHRDQYLF